MDNEGDISNVADTPESGLDALLANAGLGVFSEKVQDEVDSILAAGQSLEPEARNRFIAAAARGARDRSLRHRGALETLLFEVRRAAGKDAEDLSSAVGVDAKTIRAIERGETSIDAGDANTIALWALALEIDRNSVAGALRRSLGTRTGELSYAGERELRLTPDQESFVEDVLQAFDQRSGTAPTE